MQTYIRHYLLVLKRYFLLIIVGIVLCTVLTGVFSIVKKPQYEAMATVQVSIATGDGGNDVFSNQAMAVSYALKVTHHDVLTAAAKKLNLSVQDVRDAITAAPLEETQLISIYATTENPQKSADVANTVANAFIENEKGKETQRLQNILHKIQPQIADAQNKNDQTTVNGLQATYNDIQTQLFMVTNGISLEEQALPPTAPNGTSLTTNLLLGFSLSFILMCVLALLLDWIDLSLKTPEDVTHRAQLVALGSIPLRKKIATLSTTTIASDQMLDEAFAIMSVNLQAAYTGQRALLVTGMRDGAGASSVAAQLAISLAQTGLRVLLIDANLGQPTQHNLFTASNARGLTTVLSDVYTIKKQRTQLSTWLNQWKTTTSNLWLLPAGPTSVPPLTVLRSAELRKLVSWLLQDSVTTEDQSVIDLIIFDAPALQTQQADVHTLAMLCDGSVLVTEAGKSLPDKLKNTQVQLQRLAAPLLGIVINRQQKKHYSYLYRDQQPETDTALEVVAVTKYPSLPARPEEKQPLEDITTPTQVIRPTHRTTEARSHHVEPTAKLYNS